MKCKRKLFNFLAIFFIGYAIIGLSQTVLDNSLTTYQIQRGHSECFPHNQPVPPRALFQYSSEISHSSDPMAYLFQFLFILFIISPPLIVILLFLIWLELKKRNNMK